MKRHFDVFSNRERPSAAISPLPQSPPIINQHPHHRPPPPPPVTELGILNMGAPAFTLVNVAPSLTTTIVDWYRSDIVLLLPTPQQLHRHRSPTGVRVSTILLLEWNKTETGMAIAQDLFMFFDKFRVVIDISDDDDSDDDNDLVIIGEKPPRKIINKGKTILCDDDDVIDVDDSNDDVVIIGEKVVNKSSNHANFKDEILNKFSSFKHFDIFSGSPSDHAFLSNKFLLNEHKKNWAKRIQKEWEILKNSMPDSMFVRVYESRMELMTAVIIGAEGTPYHDGLFFIDLCLPYDFPNRPPMVRLHNPCASSKLNPNIGARGSICLSLLNTTTGKKNECWRPRSTILQVLVSIQGLVLTTDPYLNGPFDCYRGLSTRSESLNNIIRTYNENAFLDSLRTMIHVIRRPLKNFEDFVVGHFLNRAHDILSACKAYSKGVQVCSLVKSESWKFDRQTHKSLPEYFTNTLCCLMKELANEFARIGAMD
ncbi:putative ubiquitin-conjugating enzyme E2 25-like [Trifolium medium]|uniref:Putative ubiquitin-conjugating enzyme E2 25-like n=1 Tax=Trifolium medium TaxID=97028 RepID=A0A392LWK6_9FABA|nr:putative ubiquitin-conjugating enzyme E2 25-like [Trifolium medium]